MKSSKLSKAASKNVEQRTNKRKSDIESSAINENCNAMQLCKLLFYK